LFPGRFFIFKGPCEPKDFIDQMMAREDFPIGRAGLLHTRAASVGEPTENGNNHPINYKYEDRGVIITHNGGIGNLDAAYKALALDPPAEVDSALIAVAMAKLGPLSGLKFLEAKSGGNAAIAALYQDGTLVLAKNGNPLYLSEPAPGALVWSSCERQIQLLGATFEWGIPMFKVSTPKDGWFGIWDRHGNLTSGEWKLPIISNPPKWLRQARLEREKQEREEREAEAKKKLGFQPPPSSADTLQSQVRTEDSSLAAAKDMLPRAEAGAQAVAIPIGVKITCHWQGCYKKSWVSFPWEGRFVPVCNKHHKRVAKQKHRLMLAPSGEISRKRREDAK
jgi:hypothetical protein